MLRIFLIALGFISFTVNAQNVVLANVVDGKAFIGHTVASSETLYGIGRAYGISPKDLASFNGLNPQKGLEKNKVLKIPITPATISAKPCSGCNTIKYAVQPHEGLYRIGVNFGNIGTQNLTKLNNLTSDNLATGQELVVGYMKSTGNEISMVDNSNVAPLTEEPVAETKPIVAKEKETTITQQAPVVKTPVKEVPAQHKQETVTTTQPVVIQAEKKQELPPVVKNETSTPIAADGVFGAQYTSKFAQTKSGTASIFKSISGWQDKKYYVLINSIEPGAILRITNVATGKAIYAKVLGQLPYVKGSDALLMRISDAGAVALGAGDEMLQVTVNY